MSWPKNFQCIPNQNWVNEPLQKLAKKYDFLLAVDECYIDIYRTYLPKPIGVLNALIEMKSNLDNVIIFNSLSKRSNVPGLRAGFILGDEKVISVCGS